MELSFTGLQALGIFLFQLPQLLRLQAQAATHVLLLLLLCCFVGWFRFFVRMGKGFWRSNSRSPLPTEPSPHPYPHTHPVTFT